MKQRHRLAAAAAVLSALAFSAPAAAGGFGVKPGHPILHVPHKGGSVLLFGFNTSGPAFKHHGWRHAPRFHAPRGHAFGHRKLRHQGFRQHGFKPHRFKPHRFKPHRFKHGGLRRHRFH